MEEAATVPTRPGTSKLFSTVLQKYREKESFGGISLEGGTRSPSWNSQCHQHIKDYEKACSLCLTQKFPDVFDHVNFCL